MSDPGQVDYDALAKQYGATSSTPAPAQGGAVDYDALAKQYGATSSTPPPERTALDSVKDFAGNFWKQVNPISGLKGARDFAAHPIDTLKNDAAARQSVYDKAEAAFKKGDYVAGAAHLLYSLIPLAGPQLSEAGSEMQQGEYAKGAGTSVGMGVSMAAPAVVPKMIAPITQSVKRSVLLGRTPAEAYQSALKPSTTLSEAERANVVQTGLDEGIPVSKDGLAKISDLIDSLNSKVKAQIASDPTRPINKFSVASRLSDTANRFTKQVSPTADLEAISNVGNDFLETAPNPIPATEAQAMKQGTYRALGDKSYGELKGASVEAQKALARGLKDEIAQQFPELKNLNARESQLLNLEPILERAVNRIGNHQLIGIGTPVAAGAVKAVTGSGKLAAVAGVVKAVLDDPAVKSRLAIALSKGGGLPPAQALAKISSYQALLGSAAVGHQTSSSEDTQGASTNAQP